MFAKSAEKLRKMEGKGMKRARKGLLAFALCFGMAGSMTACGGSSETSTEGSETGEKKETAEITEPVTIQIWHASAAGKNEDYMNAAMEEFNRANEYGITVEGTYIGSYADVLSKTSTAIAAGDAPNIIVIGTSGIPILAEEGMFADMSAYAERDGVDVDNFVEGTADFCYYGDQLITFPFNRSTAVFAYNKTMWDELGLEPPESLEELAGRAAQVTEEKPDIKGFSMVFDVFYYQEAIIRGLGSDGFVSNDGKSAGGLEDGNFEKLLTDWRSWLDAGWCGEVPIENAGTILMEDFAQGKISSCFVSCGSLGNMSASAKEAGFELGVSYMPVYGGYGSNGGGGNLAVVGAQNSEEEIAASWEFVKFLESDEWAAKRAVDTGYLPVTTSCTETEAIQKMWEETPIAKVAFEQLQYCRDCNWSTHQSEWDSYVKQAMSYVIQDKSMTPAEAIEYLKEQEQVVFAE